MSQSNKKLFCEINPTCYKISVQKEICKRHIKNAFDPNKLAKKKLKEKLPNIVSQHTSYMIKTGPGIDPILQKNKAENIKLACNSINGIIIHPGEVFSFWYLVGKISKRKGYKEGRVLKNNKLIAGLGGGLCNLSNTIHLLVLHSPLEVVEFHSHSDALAPDKGERIPFSAGTSITYNHLDYRFKNTSSQNIQLILWCDKDTLYAELRSEAEFPYDFELIEEDHHFKKENEKYYRISKIYKITRNKSNKTILKKELVLDNHSEVMFNYDLIPKDQIRN